MLKKPNVIKNMTVLHVKCVKFINTTAERKFVNDTSFGFTVIALVIITPSNFSLNLCSTDKSN